MEPPLHKEWEGRFTCPHAALLLPTLESALPEAVAAPIRDHLDRCVLCAELCVALEAAASPTMAETKRIRDRVRRQTKGPSVYRWVGYSAAAAVLVMAATLYVVLPTGEIQTPGVAPPAPRDAGPRPHAPVLALVAPTIQLPPESLALRSASRGDYARALEDALEPFSRGNYAEAQARLERVARAHPNRAHVELYLGVSRLLQGKAREAVPALERARALDGPGGSLYDVSTWYLAVALEHSGRPEVALAPLMELCGSGGARDRQACEGLRTLLGR